jgi:hypothetical protein
MERMADSFGSSLSVKFHPQPAATRPTASRPLILFSLGRMHAPWVAAVASLFLASLAVAEPQNDPTAAYAQRVQATLVQMTIKTVKAQPQLLNAGHIWLTCRIGSRGDVQRVDVVSRHRVPGITEAFASALKSAKFPPIPKDVIKQRGEYFIDVTTHFGID